MSDIRNGSANGRTVVNGLVLDRFSLDDLLDFANDLWEAGSDAKDDGDADLSASLWVKYQTVIRFIESR
jgi:hypothetical protein